MSRATEEWIGKTDGEAIPARVQLRVFGEGICRMCGRKLRSGHWACDHIVALINGGEHRESNLQPLCSSPCHWSKTRRDVATKSRTYRKRKAHVGPKPDRTIRAWRKFDGSPVYADRKR